LSPNAVPSEVDSSRNDLAGGANGSLYGEAINAEDHDEDHEQEAPGKKEPTVDELLAAIAKATLHIDTLETRKSDSLDFHDVAVWSVKAALEAAYRAGLAAAKEER
jgi:hypothetical protein